MGVCHRLSSASAQPSVSHTLPNLSAFVWSNSLPVERGEEEQGGGRQKNEQPTALPKSKDPLVKF